MRFSTTILCAIACGSVFAAPPGFEASGQIIRELLQNCKQRCHNLQIIVQRQERYIESLEDSISSFAMPPPAPSEVSSSSADEYDLVDESSDSD